MVWKTDCWFENTQILLVCQLSYFTGLICVMRLVCVQEIRRQEEWVIENGSWRGCNQNIKNGKMVLIPYVLSKSQCFWSLIRARIWLDVVVRYSAHLHMYLQLQYDWKVNGTWLLISRGGEQRTDAITDVTWPHEPQKVPILPSSGHMDSPGGCENFTNVASELEQLLSMENPRQFLSPSPYFTNKMTCIQNTKIMCDVDTMYRA